MGSATNCEGNGNGKNGILVTGIGVHTVEAMAKKKLSLLSQCERTLSVSRIVNVFLHKLKTNIISTNSPF